MSSIARDRGDFKPLELISRPTKVFPGLIPPIATTVGDERLAYSPPPCISAADCPCANCIRELVAERRSRDWKDAWFGVGLPPIPLSGGGHGI
jgi:hypothetical protein